MTLQELRNRIDVVDAQLVVLFLQRLEISEAIGSYKKDNNLPVLDEKRQTEKLTELCAQASAKNEAAVRRLFEELIAISRARQEGKL